MGKFVLKDAVVNVNGVDISDHVSSVEIETNRDEVDVTAMGASNKETIAGLGDATIKLTVFQDFAASDVDATIWPLSSTDTPFSVWVTPTSAAVSATNPRYELPDALLFSYSPLSGGIGDASETDLEFKNAGQQGLVRYITPASS